MALTNGYVKGFVTGKIYTGPFKKVCVPGLNCYSCPGAIGSCPVGSLQAVLDSPLYKASLYVFGLLSMFGVVFGRFICGWMCPFGFVQDLLYKIPVRRKRRNLPGHKRLKYLRYVVLALFVLILPSVVTDVTGTGKPWFCEYICPSGTLFAGIPLLITNKALRSATGFLFSWKMLILLSIIFLSILVYRPFCKYLCPLGAFYGLFNPVSVYRLKIDENLCDSCRVCQDVCPMDIRTFQTPNSTECIRCGKCMQACPHGAISSSVRGTVLRAKKNGGNGSN